MKKMKIGAHGHESISMTISQNALMLCWVSRSDPDSEGYQSVDSNWIK